MRVVGLLSPVGPTAVRFTVEHGRHPLDLLLEAGFAPVSPLSAQLLDGELVFTYVVREIVRGDVAPHAPVWSDPSPGRGKPTVRQRVGSYAIVVSERGLLGTVNSSRTGAPGTWALPGGGIDPGESPSEAVMREVFEETGQDIRLDRVLTLESDHWVGKALTGGLEDFHALRIIYAATCEAPSDPVVHDLGGSTEGAGWVPVRQWRGLHWTTSSRALLSRYARQLVRDQSLK